ncbi:unnamed protein product [Paramecium sonneborni]|uniref:Uncharacterized protein n=1 Tax=Paramecium sonneborni TaxID=65129 RepID=A0A8S1L8A8_9CILI|nr:unnamed protein product [Paramecium sonneborni]
MEDDFQFQIISGDSEGEFKIKNNKNSKLKIQIEKQVNFSQLCEIKQNAKIIQDEFELDIIYQENKKNDSINNNKDLKQTDILNLNQICNIKQIDQTQKTNHTNQSQLNFLNLNNSQLEKYNEFSDIKLFSSIESKKLSSEKLNQQKSFKKNNIKQAYQIDNDNTDEADSEDIQAQKSEEYTSIKKNNKDQKEAENVIEMEQKQEWLIKNRIKRHENQGETSYNESFDILEIVDNGQKSEVNLFEQGQFKRSDNGIKNTQEQKQFQFKKELFKQDLERLQSQSNANQNEKKQEIKDPYLIKKQIQNNKIQEISNPQLLPQNFEVKKIFEKRFEPQKDNWDFSKYVITSTDNKIDSVKSSFELQPIDQVYQTVNDSNQKIINSYFSSNNQQNFTQSILQKQQIDPQIKQQNLMIKQQQEKQGFIQRFGDDSIKNNQDIGKSLKQIGKDFQINQKKPNHQEIKQSHREIELLQQQKQQRFPEGIKKSLNLFDLKQQQPLYMTSREKERKKFEMQVQILDNPLVKQQGQRETEELLNEDKHEFRSIKIEKKKTTESLRLSKFKMILDNNMGESFQVGKPIFEFNRLLKYLFLKNYDIPDIADQEQKVIPNKFQSSEEYCRIFEYLFLNEATAQIKQDLIEFLKKIEKTTKYRKVQIKIDESDNESEGAIFIMRGPQTNLQKDPQGANNKYLKVQDEKDENQSEDQKLYYDSIKDGVCDLTTLKNFIVIISSKINIKLRQINQLHEDKMIFFGILIDPQKAQYLQQIRIQTFINKQSLNVNQWHNVFLFPFSKITTLIREYQMITRLNYKTPLAKLIYNPTSEQQLIGQNVEGGWTVQFKNQIQNKELLYPFLQTVYQKYNESQANSIRDIILKEKGICLLQGPPGTGKTHTLIGLLSGVYEYMKLMNKFPRKKILICAPSNAAIDEIILRILQKEGLFDSKGNPRQANIIRIGLLDEENIHSDIIKKVSLEDLAQHKLFSTQKLNAQQDQKTTADLRIELCQIQNHIKKLEKKLNQHGISSEDRRIIKDQINQFNDLRKMKQEYLDKTRENKKMYKEYYNQFCEKLLNDAEIICSTLSSSGSDKLSKYLDQIDLLIVDEAAQCTEPSNIIPLRLGIEKMILIGDPKQLPATTFSPVSNQTLYNRSLFERILDNNFEPYFLDIQYRMHSEIRMFPSEYFYGNKLKDHQSTNSRYLPTNFFQNRLLFLDILDGQEKKDGTSNINEQEAFVIVQFIKSIKEEFPSQTIGVICAYKSQVRYIKTLLKKSLIDEIFLDQKTISINTVDSFQGQEKDIILFSCVRSSQSGGIGFLNDGRRMNVALTRAKNALFIFGNAITLSKSELWKSMLKNMVQRQLYRNIDSTKFSFELLLKDQWNFENKQTSQKLISYLKQSNQENQEKSTYNISDFQIEIAQNQKFENIQNHEIIQQQYKIKKNNNKESVSKFKIIINNKEKDRSTSEYEISKKFIKNQQSHILQSQSIKNNQDNSKIINNQQQVQMEIKAEQKRKNQSDTQLQNKEHQLYEDFDLIRCLREEGLF